MSGATIERERTEHEQLRESLRRAREKYAIAAAGLHELNADLEQIAARIAQLDTSGDDAEVSQETSGRMICGCRPAGTLDGAGGLPGYRDPGHECHRHWRERVARDKGWAAVPEPTS